MREKCLKFNNTFNISIDIFGCIEMSFLKVANKSTNNIHWICNVQMCVCVNVCVCVCVREEDETSHALLIKCNIHNL
jgi:hypothetical protein